MVDDFPWQELVLEIGGDTPVEAWLEPWSAFCPGRFRVRFLNRFGCFFLERADGRVEMLDVFYGQLEPIAGTLAEFEAMMNDPSWRQVYLLADYVSRLRRAGKIARDHECYALAPPPLVGGPDPWGDQRLPVEAAMLMEVEILQRLYADHVAKALEADLA
jgi:hypothetical protein